MGQFESWNSKSQENEEAELYKRCIQIWQSVNQPQAKIVNTRRYIRHVFQIKHRIHQELYSNMST